jgi:UDP-N-acetylmuramoyl-tripeptide--D-alanyl-D-alanine ligase
LATLDAVTTDRMRVAVLGSMLELGEKSDSLHEEIARRALESRAAVVAGVGAFERALRAIAATDPRVVTSADAESLWPELSARLAPDAFILLKGSRGMRLERLLPKLREFAGVPPESAAVPH